MDETNNKRRRVKTNRFDFESLENEEQRIMQQVMKNSLIDKVRVAAPVPEAPTFYPTLEEFKNPIRYITGLRKEGEKFGICKIVPPPEWKHTCQLDISENNTKLFPTRLQDLSTVQEGEGFEDGKKYTFASYKNMADAYLEQWEKKYYNGRKATKEELAKDYWDIVEVRNKEAVVEYGNDLDTEVFSSGFPQKNEDGKFSSSFKIKSENNKCRTINLDDENDCEDEDMSNWNLNKLPSCSDSVLKFIKMSITGVNVPWLYVGMLFSSFCWHIEDNYLYSINYSHLGGNKQWYGIPPSEAKKFEQVSKDFLLQTFEESPDLLQHMTTQISLSLLQTNKVPVYQLLHTPGSFVVTFPKSFHCGFSYGFNIGEAVNFGTHDWIKDGCEAEENYRLIARGSVFSHQRLLFTLFHNFNLGLENIPSTHLFTLSTEINKLIDEEISSRRDLLLTQHVRDISSMVKLPENDFQEIGKKELEFDDLRLCSVCKVVCLFSAVACECDQSRVSCNRHFHHMCKCSNTKKFMLTWATEESLMEMKKRLSKYVNFAKVWKT